MTPVYSREITGFWSFKCLGLFKPLTGIFSVTINVINVKLCMMALLLIELYLFILLSVTFTIFQCHSTVKRFLLKILHITWFCWSFVGLLSTSSRSWIYYYFWLSHKFIGDNWHISWLDNNFHVSFWWTLWKWDFFLSNFAWLLPCLGSTSLHQVYDVDLVSRSQVC